MSKLKLSTREIGSVTVFDLEGSPTQETLQEIAWKIQKNIRRHRVQRIILNLQKLPLLDSLGIRKLLAACLRPQQSIIYGASKNVELLIESTYLPHNVRLCHNDVEVAEDFGPFLLEKDKTKEFPKEMDNGEMPPGIKLERRRSKRMHVAIPLDLKIKLPSGEELDTSAIATNISEGGLFAEYLNLQSAEKIESLDRADGLKCEVIIHPSANFPEEYHLQAIIRRKELRKKQLGLGIEFVA